MYDVVLRGGTVLDGLGTKPRTADVAIEGDRVVAVGRDVGAARRVIDVDGLMVAPGFIDPHAHSDLVPLLPDPQPFKLVQGVTTEIVGQLRVVVRAPHREGAARGAGQAARALRRGRTAREDVRRLP